MTDLTASVRARLEQKARERGITFQYASVLYMQEGLLARIVLKGAFLLYANQVAIGRTTKDIDFLGDGISNDPEALAGILASVSSTAIDDGLSFDVKSIRAESITEGADYHGIRLRIVGRLGSVRNTLQIDVGFGDAIEGGPRRTTFRKLLDDELFSITAYPPAAVIAEKFETMIALGSVNSRMKDYYDLWYILEHVAPSDEEIQAAMRATFARRRTAMPLKPGCLFCRVGGF